MDEVRKRKHGDEDYVRRLEDQIRAMRSILEDANLYDKSAFDEGYSAAALGNIVYERNLSLDGRIVQHSDVTSPGPAATPPSSAQDTSPLALEELGSLMWKLSIGKEGETSFTGPTCGFNFPELSDLQKSSPGTMRLELAGPDATGIYGQDVALKRRLRDCFAEYLNPIHQFVNESILASVDDFPFESLELQFLHSVVFATSAAFSQLHNSSEIAAAFASYAESIALTCCRQSPSIFIVQGLTILAWHELSQGLDGMAWVYLSMAAGLIIHLGLHVTALDGLAETNDLPLSDRHGLKIRTFWSFFLVDRIATATLGRNCTIPWRRIRVLDFGRIIPPSHATIEEVAFDAQCKLWFLSDKFLDRIYSFEFNSLLKSEQHRLLGAGTDAFVSMFNSADDRLKVKSNAACKPGIFFQIAYHTGFLLIHRPFLARAADEPSISLLAVKAVIEAANSVTHLIRIYYKTQTFVNAPVFLIHQILNTALIHLWTATSVHAVVQQQSSGKLGLCMKALEHLKVTWHDRGEKALLMIRILAQRWGIVRALPMRFSHPLKMETKSQDENLRGIKSSAIGGGLGHQETAHPTELESDGTSAYYQQNEFGNYFGPLDTLADLNTIDGSLNFEGFDFTTMLT
ncbi:hypothetical protein IFR05_000870 [Cadophora sp. M221]|nr:hypothetical protein IFR05_000870 [Cadophora sp. M221]